MEKAPPPASGSLLKQLLLIVVATVAAAGLGYVAANGLKAVQEPAPAARKTTPEKTRKVAQGKDQPCSECEQRHLPTP